MGLTVFAIIVIVAIAAGVVIQLAEKRVGYDWLMIAVTATFGAYFASETFPGSTLFESIKNWGPQADGFYIVPGIIAGAVLALVAFLGTRNLEPRVRTA